MGKYGQMLKRAQESVEYWAQLAMRRFVSEAIRRMDDGAISRAQLAANLRVSPAYVTKILRGDVNFTLESMVKVARAVGGQLDVRIVDPIALDSWTKVKVPQVTAPAVARTSTPPAHAQNDQWRHHLLLQLRNKSAGQDDTFSIAA
jgi:transcriptional regulator with XRE-family HTH domain